MSIFDPEVDPRPPCRGALPLAEVDDILRMLDGRMDAEIVADAVECARTPEKVAANSKSSSDVRLQTGPNCGSCIAVGKRKYPSASEDLREGPAVGGDEEGLEGPSSGDVPARERTPPVQESMDVVECPSSRVPEVVPFSEASAEIIEPPSVIPPPPTPLPSTEWDMERFMDLMERLVERKMVVLQERLLPAAALRPPLSARQRGVAMPPPAAPAAPAAPTAPAAPATPSKKAKTARAKTTAVTGATKVPVPRTMPHAAGRQNRPAPSCPLPPPPPVLTTETWSMMVGRRAKRAAKLAAAPAPAPQNKPEPGRSPSVARKQQA
nr:PREDICTED: protein app1-like [Megachile rotundata]